MHTRTFSSDLEFKVSPNDEYERIFELEWLGRRPEFSAIAGYTHCLADHAGPMMQDVCEQPHARLGVYISREPDADIALGVEFTNECNLACAFCYRSPTRADCLFPGRILYLFRLHPGV